MLLHKIFSPVHVRLYLERAPARPPGPPGQHCAPPPPGALSTDHAIHAGRELLATRTGAGSWVVGLSASRIVSRPASRSCGAATYWREPRNRESFLISVQKSIKMYLSTLSHSLSRFDNPHDALPVPLNDGDARARCTRRHDYTHGRKSAFPSDHADLNLLRSAV